MESSDTEITEIHWTDELEDVIASIGERCLCYHWLHSKAEKFFSKRHDYFTIPVIILNTLTGTSSVGSSFLFDNSKIITVVLGFVSIFIGIINMINNHYSFAKKSENHRMSAINYNKLHDFIKIELSLPRNERMEPKTLLKSLREQTERLNEISNQIPDDIIIDFQKRFKDNTPQVSKPEIMDILEPIIVNRSKNRSKTIFKKDITVVPINEDKNVESIQRLMIKSGSPKISNSPSPIEKDIVEIYNNTDFNNKKK